MTNRQRAMSLLETIVGVSVFSGVMLLVLGALVQSFKIWNQTNSRTSTEEVLFKIHTQISKELSNTGRARTIGVEPGPVTIASVPDGNALWFLSFVDPDTGEAIYHDGTLANEAAEPRWQRNILYYSVVPSNHDTFAGQSCTGADGGEGFEDQCPHKVLVRKIIDLPDDANGNEPLWAFDPSYLDRPNGIDTSSLGGSDLDPVHPPRVVGVNILTFRADLTTSPPPNEADEVEILLRASFIDEAKKVVALGSTPLSNEKATVERRFSVFPKNAPGETP